MQFKHALRFESILCRHIGLLVIVMVLTCMSSSQAMAAWVRVESGTLAWLRSVYLLDEKHGWAVGSGGTFLITEDGGVSWKQIGKITNHILRDVYFFDERRGWLLCERDRFASGTQPLSYLLKTEDGGYTWERFDIDSANSRLVRLVFSKGGSGLAIGEAGSVWQLLDDGVSWKRQDVPTSYLLLGGQFLSDSWRVLVGGGGTILMWKGGDGWTSFETGPKTKERINSVYFVDREHGWMVGTGGQIFATLDGGRTWSTQRSGISNPLKDVYFADLRRGFAVGDGGRIIETSDGGRTWLSQVTGVKGTLERLAFSGRSGLAVGHGGSILRYTSDE